MRLFIKNTLIFVLLLIIYFLINSMINFFILKNQKLTLEKTSILIVGDSHPQKSLNPDYFYDA